MNKVKKRLDKVKNNGKVRDSLLWERRRSIMLLEDSRAAPVRPSDKDIVKMKTLSLL
jgi:hypothetical protein